jgi:hypothetical protein
VGAGTDRQPWSLTGFRTRFEAGPAPRRPAGAAVAESGHARVAPDHGEVLRPSLSAWPTPSTSAAFYRGAGVIALFPDPEAPPLA